jgi:mannose-6-phosphate isomerase-like protein (cupin superfamily)
LIGIGGIFRRLCVKQPWMVPGMPTRLLILGAILLAPATGVLGQPSAAAAPAQMITHRDLMAALAEAKSGPGLFSKTMQSADISGVHLSFDVIRRFKPEGRGLVHDRVTEIYEIVDGSGTLISGGLLRHATPIPRRPDTLTIGPSRESADLQGGVRRPVAAGDIVIIPAGTPHEFASINDHITYRVTRIDPGR